MPESVECLGLILGFMPYTGPVPIELSILDQTKIGSR